MRLSLFFFVKLSLYIAIHVICWHKRKYVLYSGGVENALFPVVRTVVIGTFDVAGLKNAFLSPRE